MGGMATAQPGKKTHPSSGLRQWDSVDKLEIRHKAAIRMWLAGEKATEVAKAYKMAPGTFADIRNSKAGKQYQAEIMARVQLGVQQVTDLLSSMREEAALILAQRIRDPETSTVEILAIMKHINEVHPDRHYVAMTKKETHVSHSLVHEEDLADLRAHAAKLLKPAQDVQVIEGTAEALPEVAT